MKLRIFLVVFTGFLTSMFNACAPAGSVAGDASSSSSGGANTAGLSAYKAVYDWSRSAKCSSCHNAGQAPFFAADDFNKAYTEAKKALNLTAVDTSTLIEHAGSGHCGSICAASNIAVVKPLVEAWAAAELSGPDTGTNAASVKYTTVSMKMPATIPNLNSNAQPAVVRFELSQMQPAHPALTNAILEVEVQRATPTTYRLNRVKIAGNTAAVMVKGIHVYIKPDGSSGLGSEDANQGMGWVSVQATAPTFARPATLPATPLGATPVTSGAINAAVRATATGASDAITIGIENLQ